MKKYLAALAAATFVTLGAYAVGSSGDIVSVDAVPVNEQGIEYPNMSSPCQVGESFYILVRLQNENWDDVDPHPWVLERSSDHSAASKAEAYAYWPALRIAIGGQKVDAEFVWTGPNGEPSGAANQEYGNYYTDFYFKYTVKEGQLGLPVRLVDARDKIVEDPSTFSDTGYKFVNVNVNTSISASRTGKYWEIRNDLGTLINAWFGPDFLGPPDYPSSPHNDGPHRSFDLTAEGIYVKTVDFEESYAIDSTDPKIWREVYQGGDDESVAKDPSVTGAGSTTVYLWSSDESVVRLLPWDSSSSLEMVSWGGVNHQVLKLAIGGDAGGKFRLKGGTVAVGSTAKIVLCGTRTPPLMGSGDILPGSTLERTIRLKEPRSPTMTLGDADGAQSFKALATNPVQAVQMKLKLSQAFSNDFQVTLTAKVGETSFDPMAARCMSMLMDDGDPTAGTITNITVKPKEADYTGEIYFNFYALGTCKEIKENNNNITITPSINATLYPEAAAFFAGGDHKSATIKVTDQKPIVSATPSSPTVFANEKVDILVTVDDNWRDLQPTLATNGYKVVVQLGNNKIETNGVHFTDGPSIPFTITVPSVSDAATVFCNVQVTDPVGNVSAKFTTSVEVQPPLTADMRTFSSTSLSVEPDADPTYVEGQENVYVRAVLSSASNAKLYAFVVPMDATSSNLVETTATTNGLAVSVGDKYSGYARLKLLDGDLDGRKVNLGIVLKDKQDFNDPSAQIVTTYSTEGRQWGVTVTNAVPRFEANGSKRACWAGDLTNRQYVANGAVYSGKVAATTPITFFAQVTDPGVLDLADRTKPIRVQWEWTDGNAESGIGTESEITSVDSNGIAKIEINFQTENAQQTVTARVQDRDMQARNDYLFADGEYSFKVNIGKVPTVIIEYPEGRGGYFYENADNRLNYIIVKVSEWPTGNAAGREKLGTTNPLKVRVRIPDEFKPTDHGNLLFRNWNGLNADGVATNETIVTFTGASKAVNAGEKIYFDRYSQNGGKDTGGSLFIVQGDVVTTTKSSDTQTWAQYYAVAEKDVTIVNIEPTLTLDLAADDSHDAWAGEAGTNEWTSGETVKLNWTYSDIAKDVTNSWAAISWTLTDLTTGKRSVKVCNATGTKSITSPALASFTGNYSFNVPKAEFTQVIVTINDGDEGKYEYVFYIHVIPTKQVTISTFGPAESTGTKYNSYPGVGRGQVYVYGSTEQYEARSFLQTWNYAESDLQANLAAAGYPATNVVAYDDGKMGKLAGYPSGAVLTQLGGKWDTSMGLNNRYNYGKTDANDDWKYDSFFYCWVQLADTEMTYLPPTPTSKPSTASPKTFELANEKDDDAGGYAAIQIEAIFAREYLPSDNLGDINADGIPDRVAQLYPNLGAYSVEDGSAIDDLTKIHKNNLDLDFLPGDVDLGASKENSRYDQWKTPFTNIKEIRGWDEHLNDVPQQLKIKGAKSDNVYTDPLKDPENSTLSYLEYRAWLAAGSPEGWTPECPTDPTVEDTDGDGYPDGFEYYFWYRAHVGYWVKGDSTDVNTWTHKRQTGYKYNAGNPFEPYLIPPETIEQLFNPRVESQSTEWATVDTDDDGLPDAEEFRLGTDPLHWDTDRDGQCDGWEVMVGLDPLDPTDALSNPDLDAMAEYETENEVQVVGLDGGGDYIEYYCLPENEGFSFSMVTNAEQSAQALPVLGWTTGGISTNWYLVASNVTIQTYAHNGRYYLATNLNKSVCWAAQGPDATNLIKGVAKRLEKGTWVGEPPYTNVFYAVGKVKAPQRCYRLMQYGYSGYNGYEGIMYVRTREYNALASSAIFAAKPCVVAPFLRKVMLLHYQVYQRVCFDPRTGWKPGMTNTRPYYNFDEFMLMPYLQMEGALNADRVLPGLQVDGREWTREMIWAAYCTAIGNADTDADGMPDGWELYTMTGAPVYNEETGERVYVYNRDWKEGPAFLHAPLPGWSDATFLEEYCGLQSCGYYEGSCATIINVNPNWTNKAWPTDPYVDDTDGDGLNDMDEKNYFYTGQATTPGMGGGLNPCSWDTDGDFLPDPWEAEFAGTYNVGAGSASDSTTVNADGSTNTTHTVTSGAVTFNFDGMDGTVDDAMDDYDHDGLMNWQEYLAGAMRCWRYDDTISIWGNNAAVEPDGLLAPSLACAVLLSQGYYPESGIIDFDGQTDQYNPHLLVDGMYDIGASYFSLCTNVWDSACGSYYMFKDGIYHDLATPGDKWTVPGMPPQVCNRFTWRPFIEGYVTTGAPVSDDDKGLIPSTYSFGSSEDGNHVIFPKKYICCSPIKADTDNDGMDDYYELFHGLNPLLGASAVHDNGTEPAIDLIYEAYGGGEEKDDEGNAKRIISATCNFWLNDAASPGVTFCQRTPRSGTFNRYMDFEAYPWLTGLADADVDGDNIRNQSEAIMPDIQAASTWLHTDPSPLWLTSSDYSDSVTVRYYQVPDPNKTVTLGPVFVDGFTDTVHQVWHKWNDFPILEYDPAALTLTVKAYTLNYWNVESYGFNFEENEGYDSDHDYLSDFEEAQGKTKSASDPQDTDDPKRRQAMWFPGENALLETPLEVHELPPVDNLPAGVDLPFLYYTVECWAKPEGDLLRSQTLVERALWTGQANMGDRNYLRRNFQIGINGGRWYTKYDSAGTDVLSPVEISDGPTASTNWTHVAATYDGEMLRLYVNGVCVREKKTGVRPEHNVRSIAMGEQGSLRSGSRSWSDQVAILVGASAADHMGLVFDWWPRYGNPFARTSFADYNNYYKGYIDEVRVWDGARSAADILSDYKTRKRYTAADAEANRQAVFEAWVNGYVNRAPSTNNQLPPELKRHWTFDHLPGATKASDVEIVPGGFATGQAVTDAMAIWSRPLGWVDSWWGAVDCASAIYTDRAYIPWIIDTVGHLPRFDLTTIDSQYWSDDYAGWTNAAALGFNSYVFPRTHEPTVRWTQVQRKGNSGTTQLTFDARYAMIESIADETTHDALFDRYVFTKRHKLREGADLLPLGGAFPKRVSAAEGGMWDDATAADAWAQTGVDADNNGLPDWWEKYARANYCKTLAPSDPILWNSPVDYHGVTMPAWRAYLTDLSKGLLPDGKFYEEFADRRDLDGDGMPDWWEDMYGIDTGDKSDAKGDPDCDGLSNYQEYLISQRDNLYLLDPTLAHSATDDTLDYFLSATNALGEVCYLGELYADHDFMEDNEEDVNGLDRTKYDAWTDADEDGWSAWSEMRYSNLKMTIAQKFLSHLAGIEEVKDFPVPVIHATLRYNGEAGSETTPIVVQAFSGNNILKKPTATFTVVPGNQETRHVYLGMYENRIFHGTLAPGWLVNNYNKISLQVAHAQPDELFSWTIDGKTFRGTYAEMYAAFTLYGAKCQISAEEFNWADVLYTGGSSGEASTETPHALTISDVDATMKGHLMIINKRVGNIDLITGDFDLDLSALSELYMGGSAISMQQYFYRIEYQTQIPTLQKKSLQISLSNPDTGNLTEGTTAFIAFLDTDGDGEYTPGVDPVGFVKDVEVGWDKVPELTIEMTDVSQAAGKRFSYGDNVETLRIVRTAINGIENNVKRRIVYSREASDAARNYVFEGDMVSSAKFGLDWTNLRKDVEAMDGIKVKDLTSVTYMVVSGAGSVQKISSDSALDTFTVEYTAESQKPTAYSPSVKADGIVETARPTFKWSGSSGYTCFRLQIADNVTKKIVYSSPLSVLPARDASLRYTWTAPVSIGTNVCNDAWVLENNRTYQWRVAMYNAKFSETNDADSAWSDWAQMKTQLAMANDFTTRRGCADVTVRYYGPATNDLSDVIVQLYRNADFAGEPAAQTRLFDVDGVATNLARNVQTVRFRGLEAGDYYAVAFIDRNRNSKRDRYETWGYSAQVGLTLAAIWRNAPVAVDPDSNKIPDVEVYMEDTDINGDDILDWNQDIETYLAAAASATTSGADVSDTDLDGLGKDIETGESYTNPEKWDTDGDGLPDGWEYSFAGTDPLDADADTVIAGDVMAYAEIKRTVITVKSQATGAKTDYALAADEVAPTIGSNVNGCRFYALYDYGSVKGLGQQVEIQKTADYQFAIVSNTLTAVTNHCLFVKDLPLGVGTNLFEETAWKALGPDAEGVYLLGDEITLDSKVSTGTNTVVSVKPAKVSLGENRVDAVAANQTIALVHAQVFDAFGFNQKTAIAANDAVNTKAFTALDKYLLIRYFQAMGVKEADEEKMNINQRWAEFTLPPNDTDYDRDGIADGWELYVMFGPKSVTNAVSIAKPVEAAVSPWNYADRASDLDGEALPLVGEYNLGKSPTNPWNKYTLNDTIDDLVAQRFDIATGAAQLEDNDHDGLSNWAEYLLWRANYFAETNRVDDAYSLATERGSEYALDYFTRVKTGSYKGWYAGELPDAKGTHLIADHDFIEDWWEDKFDVNFVNRYVYDFYSDKDGDGWSNWAEARVGCDPTRIATLGVDNMSLPEFPVPMVVMTVNSDSEKILDSPIVFQAWKSQLLSGIPDAMWSTSLKADDSAAVESDATTGETTEDSGVYRYIGTWQNKTIKFNLAPGSITPGSVRVQFKDLSYATTRDASGYNVTLDDVTPTAAIWVTLVVDKANPEDPTTGVLLEKYTRRTMGAINYLTGEVEFRLGSLTQRVNLLRPTESAAGTDGKAVQTLEYCQTIDPTASYIKVLYGSAIPGKSFPATFYLSDADQASAISRGHLKEGLNNFIAFADLNSDGIYTAGEPFGFVRNVHVGWNKVPQLYLSLSTYGSAMPRMNLAAGVIAGDRDVTIPTNEVTYAAAVNKQRVKIVRTSINGRPSNQVVFSRVMDFSQRTYLTEADVIRGNTFGLDWASLGSAAEKAGVAKSEIKTVEYRVILGDGSTKQGEANNVALTFVNTYDASRVAPYAVSPSTNSNYKLLSAQPTFNWTGSDNYTAYRIQIAAGGTNEANVVWSSGIRAMPALMPNGYSYVAPVYVGCEFTDERGVPTGKWFEDGKTYFWRVTQYNSKYNSEEKLGENDIIWSDWASFHTATDSERADSGYGKVMADIRYYGNAANGYVKGVSTSNVIVEAYLTADFTGNPVARMRLGCGALENLAKTDDSAEHFMTNKPNVALDGLPPGDYYMLAYIDINTNGTREVYEPWGYACQVGKVQASEDGKFRIWEPDTIDVKSVKDKISSAIIFIEDTDVNQNMTPDCLEDMSNYVQAEGSDSEGDEGGTTTAVSDADGDGLTATEEDEAATDPQTWDTDGDGMPDGWEAKFANTDPTDEADGTNSITGDVMAYLQVTYPVLRVRSTETGLETSYVVTDGHKYFVGDNLNGKTLNVAYNYSLTNSFNAGNTFGMGRAVTVAATADYKLAFVTNTVFGSATNYLFDLEAAIDVGTNVNGMAAWEVRGYEAGHYLRGAETNFPAAGTEKVFGSNTVLKVSTVKVSLGENRIVEIVEKATVALVHAQVYDYAGFNPKTCVATADAVNTKAFTGLDKYLVVRYLEAIGLADEKAMNKAGVKYTQKTVADSPWAKNTLSPENTDNDKDGMADGWELYVMFGTNTIAAAKNYTSAAATPINPWTYADARQLSPGGEGVKNVEEYNKGRDPSDPWSTNSLYAAFHDAGLLLPGTKPFSDADVQDRFAVNTDDRESDDDNDQVTNFGEWQAYYYDPANLGDLNVEDAWSDDATPDYFRLCGSKYLGLLYNGGEFIEPSAREELGMVAQGLVQAGTRVYDNSGWDYWSVVRNSYNIEYAGINDTDLTFVLKYLDCVVPGECTAKTLPELREFVHTQWAGVERSAWSDDDYTYEYTYDEETGNYTYKSSGGDNDTRMVLVGDQLVTLDEMILFFGGRNQMQKTIDSNKQAEAIDEIVTPEPTVNLTVKYWGNTKAVLLVEAYQVNPAYPEYGEQLTAFWNAAAEFNAGVAKVTLGTCNAGSLKQGPARFVAYIDRDGDGKFSTVDTYGLADMEVGYLGGDLEIRIGDYQTSALPPLRLSDGSNTYSTIAIVRSAVNGVPLYDKVSRVFLCEFKDNTAREALYPAEYACRDKDYIGLDKNLSKMSDADKVETVTYEVLRLRPGELAKLNVTNLNNYMIITNGVTNIYTQAKNDEFTLNYSLDPDVATALAVAGMTADDLEVSFRVPTDRAVTKFWFKLNGTIYPNTDRGYLLPPSADGHVTLDAAWFAENIYKTAIANPETMFKIGDTNTLQVAIGNDKFSTRSSVAWVSSATAQFVVNKGASWKGKLLVQVAHPLGVEFTNSLSVAVYEKADLVNPVLCQTGLSSTNGVLEIDGLRENVEYYLAAWNVRDAGDGRKDATFRMPYDTWGYYCNLEPITDSRMAASHAFDAVKVRTSASPVTTNVVWLQDTDWNDNGIYDREERFLDIDGSYVRSVAPDYNPANIDGADSNVEITDAIENDVFAYAEVPFVCVATLLDGVETWYAVEAVKLFDGENVYESRNVTSVGIPRGTPLSNLVLRATYVYNFGGSSKERLGLGRSLTLTDKTGLTNKVTSVKTSQSLILVHAQVYDWFGFNPNTANGYIARRDWVNTKAFDSTDKAYVTNYLAHVCGFDNVSQYALTSDSPDADPVSGGRGDGIADGWELYVMYGPQGPAKGGVTHSPWNYDDRDVDADHDGLTQLHEFDGGYFPTDPWNADTDGDGVTDKNAREFDLKEAAARTTKDGDNDQLSNFAEYMISNLAGFPRLDAAKMATGDAEGQLVPDYFLRHGSLYLGEMFADHDFIEDWWEDEQGLEVSRYTYDAHKDADGDGWNNWTEARAAIAAGYSNVVVVVTNADGTVVTSTMSVSRYNGTPTPTGSLRITYTGKQKFVGDLVVKAYRYRNGEIPNVSYAPDAIWVLTANGLDTTYALGKPDAGAIAGGKNMFVVYLMNASAAAEGSSTESSSSDEEGEKDVESLDWIPGAPYGVVTDVSVGFSRIDDAAVELTDYSESMLRLDLTKACENSTFEDAAGWCDRSAVSGLVPADMQNSKLEYENYTNVLETSSKVRVRIVRTALNGKRDRTQSGVKYYAYDLLFDGYIDASSAKLFTEQNLLERGMLDLDWSTGDSVTKLMVIGNNLGILSKNLVQASYLLVTGEADFKSLNDITGFNALGLEFSNHFDEGSEQPAATLLGLRSGMDPTPAFRWQHSSPIHKAYPAFTLRIYRESDNALVYDSGYQRAPARKLNGMYEYCPPIHVGETLSTGMKLESGVPYYYCVSMHDAKFRKVLAVTATDKSTGRFTLGSSSSGSLVSDVATLPVAVKYMGPAKPTVSGTVGRIRVEAFDTPDFTGNPYAVGYVQHLEKLAATDVIELNATVPNLPTKAQSVFYVRAFIDSDGDGVRSDWESWGYGNYVGTGYKDVYTPRPYDMSSVREELMTPECVIYIEDCDTNGNMLPDAWEFANGGLGQATVKGQTTSPYYVSIDAKGAVATNLFYALQTTDAVRLPFFSALETFDNDTSLSSVSLALAMAGITNLDDIQTEPEVTITEFSLTDGLKLTVEPRATVNGTTLVPTIVKIEVTLTLTLQKTTALSETWQDVLTVNDKFEISNEQQELDPAKLAALNKKITDEVAKSGSAGFFRVEVGVASKQLK